MSSPYLNISLPGTIKVDFRMCWRLKWSAIDAVRLRMRFARRTINRAAREMREMCTCACAPCMHTFPMCTTFASACRRRNRRFSHLFPSRHSAAINWNSTFSKLILMGIKLPLLGIRIGAIRFVYSLLRSARLILLMKIIEISCV